MEIHYLGDSGLLAGIAAFSYVVLAALTVRLKGGPPTAIDRVMQARILSSHWRHRRTLGVIMSGPGYAGVCFAISGLLIWFLHDHGAAGQKTLAIATTGGWATHRIIKLFVKRRRPDSRKGYGHEFESFPSGHTTITTATAIAVAVVFGGQGYISTGAAMLIAIGFPIVIGAGRVVADEHWTTDVIAGWFGGIAMACVALLSSRV